jgi:hypothetical protein
MSSYQFVNTLAQCYAEQTAAQQASQGPILRNSISAEKIMDKLFVLKFLKTFRPKQYTIVVDHNIVF